MFENYVNYAGSKTLSTRPIDYTQFENYVNYAGSKTVGTIATTITTFENYVNYAGSKTHFLMTCMHTRLRTM